MAFTRHEYLRGFDGLQSESVFCLWTGLNAMSVERLQALVSIQWNIGGSVVCINHSRIKEWEHPDYPFHPAFEFLSATHQADYLRCYLMHHYGGGYTDIKHTQNSWLPFFSRLKSHPGHDGLGYTEVGPQGVAQVSSPMLEQLQDNYSRLIGVCAFIFRKQSHFTTRWIGATHALLDLKFEALAANPARHPQDRSKALFTDGTHSEYPLGWTELLGNIFHPLVFEEHQRILHDQIAPSFTNYR